MRGKLQIKGLKNTAKVSKKTWRKTTARKPTSLWKNWLETRENHYHPRKSREMSHRRTRYSKEEDRILLRIVHKHTTTTATGDPQVLDVPPPTNNDSYPILREEVKAAEKSLKKGKSAGVDNIPSHVVLAGGESMTDNMLLIICSKIWRTGEWPTPWTQSLIITLPKKGNLQLYQNYYTISLISQRSTVMLKILLSRLKPQAEEIIKEEQAGFNAGRSTTDKIFKLWILCEKYLQHQQNRYHVSLDFKKVFERVWHAALWNDEAV